MSSLVIRHTITIHDVTYEFTAILSKVCRLLKVLQGVLIILALQVELPQPVLVQPVVRINFGALSTQDNGNLNVFTQDPIEMTKLA